jgi:hypothetical protein
MTRSRRLKRTPRALRGLAAAVAVILVAVVMAWALFVVLPGRYAEPPDGTDASIDPLTPPASDRPGEPAAPRISARLFYVSDDGASLTAVERDVPLAATPATQARAIVDAQLAPVDPPLVSAIPAGTTVRAVFLTGREAYVDLSGEAITAHAGGSTAEALAVYTIVHALTTNLPAVTAVQILIDGKEVDTLAGHLSLRRPLAPHPEWIR